MENKLISLVIFAVAFLISSFTLANTDESIELSNQVREKKYVGAYDEDELRVQKNFISPRQKKKTEEADEGF